MYKIYVLLTIFTIALTVEFSYSQQIGDLDGIYYQAVALDNTGKEIVGMDIEGKPLYEKTIGVRFTIAKGIDGDVLWEETHETLTNQYGLFTLIIGHGEQTGNGSYTSMLDIPWIDAGHFLKVEISIKNDGNFKMVSNKHFMSVPYSFYADDIADDAITTDKILDSTIINQDIHTGAIDSRTILDYTTLNEDIATGSADSRAILDSTIINQDIHTGAIDSRTILNETILNEDIATGSVDSRIILDSTIINQDIHTSTADSRTILDYTILNEDIATGSVDSRTILDSTIINEDIHTGAIDSRTLLDSTIINQDIAAGSADSRTILNETILNEDIATSAINSGVILNETILAEDIAEGAVTTSEILNGTIINEDIADNTINLETKVTGNLLVQNGGTGLNSVAADNILIGTGTNNSTVNTVTDSIMILSNHSGTAELYQLQPGFRASMEIDEVNKVIIFHAVDQSGTGPNIGGGSVNTGNIPAGGTVLRNFPAAVIMGDIIKVTADIDLQGITMTAFVRQDGQVHVALFNGTGANLNLGSINFKLANFGQ